MAGLGRAGEGFQVQAFRDPDAKDEDEHHDGAGFLPALEFARRGVAPPTGRLADPEAFQDQEGDAVATDAGRREATVAGAYELQATTEPGR